MFLLSLSAFLFGLSPFLTVLLLFSLAVASRKGRNLKKEREKRHELRKLDQIGCLHDELEQMRDECVAEAATEAEAQNAGKKIDHQQPVGDQTTNTGEEATDATAGKLMSLTATISKLKPKRNWGKSGSFRKCGVKSFRSMAKVVSTTTERHDISKYAKMFGNTSLQPPVQHAPSWLEVGARVLVELTPYSDQWRSAVVEFVRSHSRDFRRPLDAVADGGTHNNDHNGHSPAAGTSNQITGVIIDGFSDVVELPLSQLREFSGSDKTEALKAGRSTAKLPPVMESGGQSTFSTASSSVRGGYIAKSEEKRTSNVKDALPPWLRIGCGVYAKTNAKSHSWRRAVVRHVNCGINGNLIGVWLDGADDVVELSLTQIRKLRSDENSEQGTALPSLHARGGSSPSDTAERASNGIEATDGQHTTDMKLPALKLQDRSDRADDGRKQQRRLHQLSESSCECEGRSLCAPCVARDKLRQMTATAEMTVLRQRAIAAGLEPRRVDRLLKKSRAQDRIVSLLATKAMGSTGSRVEQEVPDKFLSEWIFLRSKLRNNGMQHGTGMAWLSKIARKMHAVPSMTHSRYSYPPSERQEPLSEQPLDLRGVPTLEAMKRWTGALRSVDLPKLPSSISLPVVRPRKSWDSVNSQSPSRLIAMRPFANTQEDESWDALEGEANGFRHTRQPQPSIIAKGRQQNERMPIYQFPPR